MICMHMGQNLFWVAISSQAVATSLVCFHMREYSFSQHAFLWKRYRSASSSMGHCDLDANLHLGKNGHDSDML